MFFFTACSEEDLIADLNPIEDGKEPISDLPYSEIPSKEYIIDLAHWDIPSNRKDPVKTTDNLQAAIDWAVGEGYGKIRLPKGHYLIGKYGHEVYQEGIKLKSNMAFLLDKDAIIEMAPNDKWNYAAIQVRNKQHVVISGGTVLGDRYNHKYTPRESDGRSDHDEGHLITIEGGECDYVTVDNIALGRANGDAILLVYEVNHINILNNNMFDTRRTGVGIVGAANVLIEGNEIHHTKGTVPQFGINIESMQYKTEDIVIRSNHFHHNRGGDFVNGDGRNVLFENNILEQGEGSEYIDGPLVYRKNTDLTIRNNEITMLSASVNTRLGILMYSNDNPKTNPATTYIYENTLNGCGMYMYKSADLKIYDNHLINGRMAFTDMENLTLENNKVEYPNVGMAFLIMRVSGSASGNTLNDEPFEIPLSSEPWSNITD